MVQNIAEIIFIFLFTVMFVITLIYIIKTFKKELRITKMRLLILEDEVKKRGIDLD